MMHFNHYYTYRHYMNQEEFLRPVTGYGRFPLAGSGKLAAGS
jgi:hypothetical protein